MQEIWSRHSHVHVEEGSRAEDVPQVPSQFAELGESLLVNAETEVKCY
jgi:hypothetical protein